MPPLPPPSSPVVNGCGGGGDGGVATHPAGSDADASAGQDGALPPSPSPLPPPAADFPRSPTTTASRPRRRAAQLANEMLKTAALDRDAAAAADAAMGRGGGGAAGSARLSRAMVARA